MQFDRLSDGLSLAFGRNQKALADSTARLSSGLRINTAADDPSGLAIASLCIRKPWAWTRASATCRTARVR